MNRKERIRERQRNSTLLSHSLEAQRRRFRAKFGRDPGPNDPLLWDDDADTPQPMTEATLERMMVVAMIEAGTPGELIHAFQKTGMVVTEANIDQFPKAALLEYQAAVEEYLAMQKGARQ